MRGELKKRDSHNGKGPGRFTLDRRSCVLMALFLGVMLSLPSGSTAQPLAKGKSKFFGSSMSSIRPDFTTYWNQVTPENEGKWGSVEGSQGNYSWTALDNIFNFAISNSFPYKHHNLIWGQQQPAWITSLDSAGQRAAVDHWIDTVAQRYGSASFVDVVNEPFHAPPPYMNALGGAGKTGWDWVITAFQMARKYFFHGVKLLVNEYNILQDNTVTTNFIALIDTLSVRGLIDGIGIQGHYFEFKSPAGATPAYSYPIATLKSNLDRLAATGLPVYISEFDINEAADSTQLQNYQTYFPLFWENPGVRGITLWGYVQGITWKPNAYLVRTDGPERPALQWLRVYLSQPLLVSPVGSVNGPRNPVLVWRSAAHATSYHVQVATDSTFLSLVVDSTVTDTVVHLNPIAADTKFSWHVNATVPGGTSPYSVTATFTTGNLIASVKGAGGIPGEFALSQNYPNPFNPSTRISYTIGERGLVTLEVFDLLGRKVATLVNEVQAAGSYQIVWDGRNRGNLTVTSGVYFYRLRSGGFSKTNRMVFLQ